MYSITVVDANLSVDTVHTLLLLLLLLPCCVHGPRANSLREICGALVVNLRCIRPRLRS